MAAQVGCCYLLPCLLSLEVTTQLAPFMFGASSSLRHCESVEAKREVELLSVNIVLTLGFPFYMFGVDAGII